MSVTVNWTDFFASTHSELRPYQAHILDQVVAGVALGQRKFNVTIPTGAGKSWLIGLMPLKLQRAPALGLCYWQDINESNAAFYTSNHFHLHGSGELVGRVSTASNSTQLDWAGIDFVGVKKILLKPTMIHRYRLVQIDEIQNVTPTQLEAIQSNLADDAVLVVYSAMPPKAVYNDETFQHIEVNLSEVCGHVKVPKVLMVDSSGIDDKRRKRVQQKAAKRATDSGTVLSDFCRSPHLFARLMRVAMNERAEMRVGGNEPGILVRCRNVLECEHWKKVMEALEPGLAAACIHNDTPDTEKEAAMNSYEQGEVAILFVVKMLSVGWHKARTSIIVPMGGTNFSSQLQLFGRAFSASNEFQTSVLVMPDVYDEVTRFSGLFSRYIFHGVRALHGVGDVVEVNDDDDG